MSNAISRNTPHHVSVDHAIFVEDYIKVTEATNDDIISWNKFTDQFHGCGHYYQWSWGDLIYECFGHRPRRFMARQRDNVTGILSLSEVRSFLVGRALVSMPYLNGGGLLAADRAASEALLARAEALRRETSANFVELRHREPAPSMLPGWHTRSHKVAMLLPLHADPDRVFAAFTAKLRSQVRRAAKAGAVARVSTGADVPEREIDGFYHVFATNMRDLGTPVYPRRLFTSALRAFSAHARLITVWLGERCTAGAVTIGGGQVTEIPWASSLRRDNHTAANMLLYWEAIRHACLDGYCTFDFGRSTPNSGTFRFKQQWGAVPKPLYWHYFLKPDGLVPELSPNDPKYHLLTAIWQRLPLSVSRAAGPWLTRSLP